MAHPPVVDDPVTSSVANVVDKLHEADVMAIRLHESRRPEMVLLVVFPVGDAARPDASAVLVFDADHWAAGPNVPGAYFDYLGDRWTPTGHLVESVLTILAGAT